jgi:hypothetical protein
MKAVAQVIKEASDQKSITVAPSSMEEATTTQFTAEKQKPEGKGIQDEV